MHTVAGEKKPSQIFLSLGKAFSLCSKQGEGKEKNRANGQNPGSLILKGPNKLPILYVRHWNYCTGKSLESGG